MQPAAKVRGKGTSWDQIKGEWKQLRGKTKGQWGELTDGNLDKELRRAGWGSALPRDGKLAILSAPVPACFHASDGSTAGVTQDCGRRGHVRRGVQGYGEFYDAPLRYRPLH